MARQSVHHVPDEEGWGCLMQPLHDALATSSICTDRLPELHQVCILSLACAEHQDFSGIMLDAVVQATLLQSDMDAWQLQW